MKLGVFLFLILFLLPRQAFADWAPPRGTSVPTMPRRPKHPLWAPPEPDLPPPWMPPVPPREEAPKEERALLLAIVSTLGALALSRPQPQRPETAS